MIRNFPRLLACVSLTASLVLAGVSPAMAVCGDGVVDETEACDDGDLYDGDGCDSSCAAEAGHVCLGEPSLCPWTQQARLSVGGNHATALSSLSEIETWGSNGSNQQIAPLGTNYVAVAAGNKNACARRVDGSLTCWGHQGSGRSSPPPGSFVALGAGEEHACAIETDGDIVCWGSNTSGKSTPPEGTFSAIGVGHANNCAIDEGGALTCWGNSAHGRSDPPEEGTFASVSCGSRHCCAIDNSGTAQCWGANADGQSTVPDDETFAAVAAGYRHTCGLTRDARVLCWGSASYGQNEDPEGEYVALSVGWYTNCGFKTDGTLYCWGRGQDNLTTPPEGTFLPEVCGDALLVGTEQCDDGNLDGGDGCRANCTVERCGDGILDEFEECETGAGGFAACCTEDCLFLGAGSECRSSGGSCDPAESCTGDTDECPLDLKSTDVCRSAEGECDIAEYCDGISDVCPDNELRDDGTVCRATMGECDLEEICDGSGVDCPADLKRTDLCRGAKGVCDNAEYCDGAVNACPDDSRLGAETECRASGYECDAAEVCNGIDDDCPADGEAAFGATCTDDGIFCTEDICDGAGACIHPPGRAGTTCRPASHECDVGETCDGENPECPTDSGLPDTDSDETCDAQDVCPDVADPDQEDSDGDGVGDYCDICTDAGEPAATVLKITKIDTPGGDDKLLVKGYLVFDEDLEFDPLALGIRLRILDADSKIILDSAVPAGAFSSITRRGWLPLKNGGYRFRSRELIDGAIQKVILKRVQKDPKAISFKILGTRGSFASQALVPPLSVILTLDPDPNRAAGCAEISFPGPRPDPTCQLRAGGSNLVCR